MKELESNTHTLSAGDFQSEITDQLLGVVNGTSKNVGLGKFWQDLEILEAFLISLEVSFLHGLFVLF